MLCTKKKDAKEMLAMSEAKGVGRNKGGGLHWEQAGIG